MSYQVMFGWAVDTEYSKKVYEVYYVYKDMRSKKVNKFRVGSEIVSDFHSDIPTILLEKCVEILSGAIAHYEVHNDSELLKAYSITKKTAIEMYLYFENVINARMESKGV